VNETACLRSIPIFVDGDGISSGKTDVSRMSLSDYDSVLTIVNVTRQDSGSFGCRAFNSIGAATKTYALIVQGN
jgi:Immunoglobulin I-set domain